MVDLVRSGRTPEELSREFEPTAQAIWNWVRQADRDEGRRQDGPTSAEREELTRARPELSRIGCFLRRADRGSGRSKV
jgi:transposase